MRKCLHVSDNSLKDLDGNKENKLYKISPVVEQVRAYCMKIEPEPNHSIDQSSLSYIRGILKLQDTKYSPTIFLV